MRISRGDWTDEDIWHLAWITIATTLGLLDLRNERDDIKNQRTHSTGTTFSSFCRWLVEHIPFGPWIFEAGLLWFYLWFRRHILKHLDSKKASFRAASD